jgi:sec-independent protein translocase protein TatB
MSLTEILVVVVLVLVVMGPEKIPEMMRWVGRGMREVRRATNLFRDTIMVEGETPLEDELDAGIPEAPGPHDVPGAEPAPHGHDGSAPSDAGRTDRTAEMRAVAVQAARSGSGLRHVELGPPRTTGEVRHRYLSPPHRTLHR